MVFVIGAGRVGLALQRAAQDSGEACTLITRDGDWELLQEAVSEPILVATRNDDLDGVLAQVPGYRRGDLVFVQNGALGPWLEANRLEDNARGLLFFAAPDRETGPVPGPEPSPFVGRHALAVVRWMSRIGVPAQVVDWPRFRAWELEKLCWNTAFGLLCELHEADVGTVCDAHRDDLEALVDDLRRTGRGAMHVDLPQDWLVERLVAYSRSIPDYRGAVKEWPWRNGWFVQEAVRVGIPTPAHARMLNRAGYADRLPSTMREASSDA